MFHKLLRCHKLCLCGEKSFSVFNWFSIQHNITCYGSSYISPYAFTLFFSGVARWNWHLQHIWQGDATLLYFLFLFFPRFFFLWSGFGSVSRTFLSFAWFLRTLKSLCVNRLRSLLRMRCILLGYRFEPRPNSHTLGSVGSVMTICLSIKGCSHSKKTVWREKTRLTSPGVWLRSLQMHDAWLRMEV